VIAYVAGAPTFYEAIKESILDPLGIRRVRPAASLAGTSYADEAHYHRTSEMALDLNTFPSVMTADRPLVADTYGNLHLESGAAAGGLSGAVVDTARFVAAFSVSRQNPMLKRSAILNMLNLAAHSGRPRAGHGFDLVTPVGHGSYHCEKGGYLWTAQGAINFDLGGLGIVIQYNGVNDAVLFQTQWPLIRAAVQSVHWPRRTNYFPNYGFRPFS
jgi:hypothetical protein